MAAELACLLSSLFRCSESLTENRRAGKDRANRQRARLSVVQGRSVSSEVCGGIRIADCEDPPMKVYRKVILASRIWEIVCKRELRR